MSEKKPSIIPIVRGPLDEKSENDLEYNVGCFTPKSIDTKPSVSTAIIYPKGTGRTIPIGGGAIFKVGGYSDIVTRTKVIEGDNVLTANIVTRNIRKIGSDGYQVPLKKFSDYLNRLPDLSSPENITQELIPQLNQVRIATNRALDTFPDLNWNGSGVPTATIRVSFTKDKDSFKKLLKEAKENPADRNLDLVGKFKFVPIEVIFSMIETIGGLAGSAFANGPSGVSFSELKARTALAEVDSLSDDQIGDIINEIFPIFNISPAQLRGRATNPPSLGYYTAYKDNLFFKTPNVSTRGSDARARNFYAIGVNTDLFPHYALETELETTQYSIDELTFSDGLAPFPVSNYLPYGGATNAYLKFALPGLGSAGLKNCKFFLSPAIPVENPVKSKSLNLSNQYIEIFSAPNMMQPFLKDRLPTLSYGSFTTGDDIIALNQSAIFENLVDQLIQLEAFSPGEDGVTAKFLDKSSIAIGNNTFLIEELGYPNTTDLSPAGIPDVEMLAGEMNRPDVFLANKSDLDSEFKIAENNEQYFRNKLCAVSPLMSSNRPTFIDLTDTITVTKNDNDNYNWPRSIPALWVKNSGAPIIVEDPDTKLKHIEVPFSSKDLYMFSDLGTIKLIPYIVDETGQIFKVAERQIELRRRPPANLDFGLEFKFDGERTVKGSTYPWFVFKGDYLDGITGIKFTNKDDPSQSRIRFFSEVDIDLVKSTPKHLEFSGVDFDANMGEFTGLFTNVAKLKIDLIGSNGRAYPIGLDLLNVVPESTEKGEAKDEKADFLSIMDPFGEIYPDGYKKITSVTSSSEINYAYNIPVLSDGNSAKIKLASKSGILKPENNLYAYLMICNSRDESKNPIYDFATTSQIIEVENPGSFDFFNSQITGITRAQIAKNIEFKLSESGDFVATANDAGSLAFPGSYSYLNFSRLKNEELAYFIVCSQKITDITSTNDITQSQLYLKYALVRLGGNKDSAFISNISAIGSFAKISEIGGYVTNCDSITKLTNKDKEILSDADVWTPVGQSQASQIIVKSNISRLGVIFDNYNADFQYKISVNGHKISTKTEVFELENANRALIVCEDVETEYIGWADVKVHVEDSLYDVEYDSSIYSGCTIEIKNSEDLKFTENGVTYGGEDLRIANTIEEMNKTIRERNQSLPYSEIKGLTIDPRTIFLDSDRIPQSLNSFKYKRALNKSIIGINPIKISPSLDVTAGETFVGKKTVTAGIIKAESKPDPKTAKKKEVVDIISSSGSFAPPPPAENPLDGIDLMALLGGGDPLAIKGPSAESISGNGLIDSIDIFTIFISNGTKIPPNLLLASDDGERYKLTVKSVVENAIGIRFNIPELLYVSDHTGTRYYPEKIPAGSGGKHLKDLAIVEGKKLNVTTRGTDENTIFFIADKRVDIEGALRFSGTKVTSTIIVPSFTKQELQKFDPCKTIRISNANREAKRLGFAIGGDMALLVDELAESMVGGASEYAKGKIKELKALIKKYLLKFTKFTMDVSSTSKEFINSFCDLSFHLTAELKFNLRNLQLLYIPIKIIMCIIDVLCALLNPWKTASAVVRLFACLYDLLLLLPQISIPVMLLNLLLHLLELLQCIFIKIIGWMIAINEVITALDNAIKKKDYESIKALERTLNEHIFSLNAEIEVLEPIIGILLMFLEMMELIFNFSCSTGNGNMSMDDDSETCLDPTMIAGMIVGKAMPDGNIDPSKVLPMAQSYTQIPPECITANGNTPSNSYNNRSIDSVDGSFGDCADIVAGINDVLVEPVNGDFIISLNRDDENIFLGEENDDGFENVNKDSMRFKSNTFDGTFGVSFSKSAKYNSNSLDVKFEFNNGGKTNNLAFDWFFSMFYDPKLISDMQTLDSAPAVLSLAGEDLVVSSLSPEDDQTGRTGFVSPVDGHTEYFSRGTNNIAPLTMPVSSFRREFDERGEPIEPLIETVSQKVFPGVPKVAMIDDDANVYFIKENGIQFSGNRIVSIKAKLINKLSASKMKTSREKKDVFRPVSYGGNDVPGEQIVGMQANATHIASNNSKIDINSHDFSTGNIAAEDFNANNKLKATATGLIGFVMNFIDTLIIAPINALFGPLRNAGPPLSRIGFELPTLGDQEINKPAGGWEDGIPHPEYPIHNFMATSEGMDKLQSAVQTLNIFDFPRLYFFDMREVSDDIAQACQTADLNGALFDIDAPAIDPDRVWPDDFRPIVTDTQSCIELLRSFVDNGSEAILAALASSQSPDELLERLNGAQWDMDSVSDLYDTMRACVGNAIDDTCSWVVNPLNTGFKLVDDTEESEAPTVDPTNDYNDDISDGITELPKVTGAAEYASGIGDYLLTTVGEKAFVELLPRDSYDDPLSEAGDWSDKIRIEIIKDTTGGTARLVAPNEDSSRLIVKEGEKYIAAVQADEPGQVLIRAYICGIMVKAWAERGIVSSDSDNVVVDEVDCIPDQAQAQAQLEQENFGPGSIMKIDRVLTIAYRLTSELAKDPDDNAGLAKSRPQVFGTKLEN